MKKLFAVLLIGMTFAICGAELQDFRPPAHEVNGRVTIYDNHGRNAGSAHRSGDRVTYRDNHGRLIGSAVINGSRVSYYDNHGRYTG